MTPDPKLAQIRKDFPILQREVHGKPLVYFDNAATSQKPQIVIDAITNYYSRYNANIHRGIHTLSEEATAAYEAAREKVAKFLNARDKREINFVRGTTEGINLVAAAWGRKFLKADDEILISAIEHHSNIVPWQMLCSDNGAVLKVIPVSENGEWDMDAVDELLTDSTRLVAVQHTSNALGIRHPVKELTQKAHAVGAKVLIDGAQATPHGPLDVQDLECDFFTFSGHKTFGPTGIGVLWGREALLKEMKPYMGGGEMIREVAFTGTTYADLPFKFEAGTPNICGAIALGAALDYVKSVGYDFIRRQERSLLDNTTEKLRNMKGLKIYGDVPPDRKASVISFLIAGIHPYDIGVLLDKMGIAIRTGHHCCQPLMTQFGIEGTCRASMAFYNSTEEVDRLVEGLERATAMLR